MDGEPLAVIGDDSVTLRPLTGDERSDIEACARRLRRGAWLLWGLGLLARLRRDLGEGRVLVLVSSSRRVEVLAASGLPWREGEAAPAWRQALSGRP
jgi:hypothetical protein